MLPVILNSLAITGGFLLVAGLVLVACILALSGRISDAEDIAERQGHFDGLGRRS